MKADGTPDWKTANAWVGPVDVSAYPGTGDVQALLGYVMPNGQMRQGFWRGNAGYTRNVPMNSYGTPDWDAASGWSEPLSLSTLPGSGDIQTANGFMMPNGQLMQEIWRGNEGYYRTVPMGADNTPDWGAASAWSGPVSISSLPGEGDLQAHDGFVMPNGQLWQDIWRGNEGYYRTVPMGADNTPDWGAASPFSGPFPL